MATVEEMRDYVENTLGVETTTRMTKADLQQIIDGKEDKPKEVKEVEVIKAKGYQKIILQSTESDKRPLFVGVNGKGYTVPRDVEVEVPEEVLEVLRNAVKTVYDKDNTPTDIRAHNFTLI